MAKTQLDINTYPNNYYLQDTSNTKNYTNVLLTKKKKMKGNIIIDINAKDGTLGTPTIPSYTVSDGYIVFTPNITTEEGWVNASSISGESLVIPVSAVIQTETKTVKSTLSTATIIPSGSNKFFNQVNVSPIITQSKSITPSTATQTANYDSGKDCLSLVTVNPIPSEFIIPTGSTFINNEITYNEVTTYKYVNAFGKKYNVIPGNIAQTINAKSNEGITQVIVQPVPIISGTVTITQMTNNNVTNYEYANVMSGSVVNEYDSSISGTKYIYVSRFPYYITTGGGWLDDKKIALETPTNLTPSNIKTGVVVFGITGTFVEDYDIYDGYYNSGSYLSSSESGYWSGSFTFYTSDSSKSLTLYLARNSRTAKIDRNIKITFIFPAYAWTQNTDYRTISTAGWYCSGTSGGSGYCKSGNNYSYQVNDSDLKVYSFSSGGYGYARVIFKTSGKSVPSGSTMSISVSKTIKYNYDSGSLQFVPKYGSTTSYMLKCSTSNTTNFITLFYINEYTWYVSTTNGNKLRFVTSGGTTYEIKDGDRFYIDDDSETSGGYWVTTPGGRRWVSGSTSYYHYLFVNGSNVSGRLSGSSSNSKIYAICSNTSINVIYVYR